ncbi:LOW QUALITY PROTEIN: hypothetical protein OSB04_018973 [Centaurea solstitialis]|uniref:GAG-pre-integrase domain-containing protein n=1 Tax=Centaurea solstitialis TaxID=347529 RepID=A0AA38T1N3_9ASTR|nr:LOW QUALITY PROTEIN: hypothetical protein OSB04_018973 [Centaurea solstitialis]
MRLNEYYLRGKQAQTKGSGCTQRGSKLHRSKGKGRGRPFSQVKCFYCDKLGHTIKFCRKKLAEENKASNFMHIENGHNEDTMFMMLNMHEPTLTELWYLDSSCGNHMIGNKELFLTLKESKNKDSSKLRIKINKKANVFYVAGLKHNLLSVGQLIQKGYGLYFKNGLCEITDSNESDIGRVVMNTNKMFPIKFDDDTFSMSISTHEASLLWHKRFGHVNLNTLTHMYKNELVKGLPSSFYLMFVKVVHLVSSLGLPFLMIKHGGQQNNICGPMKTPSFGGSKYFLTFIDDYSRRIWIYFPKEISEALSCFLTYKAMVENQSDFKIKNIRSDRGIVAFIINLQLLTQASRMGW